MHFSISFDKHEHTWGNVEFSFIHNYYNRLPYRKAKRKCIRCCATRDLTRDELIELLYEKMGRPEPTLEGWQGT